MMNALRIGLIDGCVGDQFGPAVVARRRFPGAVDEASGHGAQVARCVLEHCPGARLLAAEVFDQRREAAVDAVIDALRWLLGQGVRLVNMSLGMATASPRLAQACREAADAAVVLVASAPARGGAVYPAAFAECIAVTGDARCAPGEVSWLATATAEFGTHPLVHPGEPRRGGGASIAAARMSGLLGVMLAAGLSPCELRTVLGRRARYLGPERRHA